MCVLNTGWVRKACCCERSSFGSASRASGLDLGKDSACRRTPATPLSITVSGVVVSSSAMPSGGRADPQVDPFRLRARETMIDLPLAVHGFDGHGIEDTPRHGQRRKAELAQPGGEHGGAAMHAACDMGQSLRARDRPHTSRRSRRAAPARCRCWRSPSRGGYAVRGFAGRGDRPAHHANPPTGRRCGRAASASACRFTAM